MLMLTEWCLEHEVENARIATNCRRSRINNQNRPLANPDQWAADSNDDGEDVNGNGFWGEDEQPNVNGVDKATDDDGRLQPRQRHDGRRQPIGDGTDAVENAQWDQAIHFLQIKC